ncbi:hypothetical protein N656DRAFT_720199 [Canariomyces notabilis]|uniref:DUF6603 domain-containing protein n=1 Tax=Canariomyces notabilis TaxID=2074819 RepID=A0AAN6QC10_9PEZI|nr:hypothetical protein N656DRAFT_720199 [Canariomyces arenarius]
MGQVVYDGGSWKLTALVENIYGSTLYQFFDPDTGSGIGSILDGIGITALGIEYDYAAGGGATNFAINGDLVIGSLGLSLDFKYAASGWTFEAYLDVTKTDVGKAKLSDVIKYVFGDHADDNLPDFILDISVVPPNDKKAVGFDMTALQVPEGATDKPLLFTAWLDFLGMSFQAIQYQPPAPGDSKVRPPARRIFVLAVNSLPPVDIPLIGNLTQPFDELLLLYVSAGEGDTAMSGVTYADLKTINGELQRVGRRPLPYRATKKQYADEDVVLTIGAHFILVLKDTAGQPKVMLDYVFYTPSTDSKALVGLWQESGPAPAPAKAPYEKRIGPLSIRNMGFKYSPGIEPMLSITMDASVALGPIALDLLGFSLDLTFEKGMTLLQLPTPSVSLSGLGVAFDRPPVILAGMFEHRHVEKPVEQDYYQGAVTLSFQPYLFTAAGYYGTTNAPSGAFISAFVYFVLNGPLIELEFAEINGVTGGFGYNTFLHFPNPTSVLDFPFLRDPGDTDPSKQLTALVGGPWFFPQDGAFWLAAGLSVKALQVLQVRLVLAVEWNPSVQLGLFGVATADMPAGSNDSLKIMHVELGITAIFDFSTDTLRIEGQLAPSSFVWNPFCHLSGGFAYYQWFRTLDTGGGSSGDAPIPAGDFVFTVGGYHRNFKPPAQYPSAVPRLSISWSFDSAISITGEAYFAITPNVVMAGGRLDASLSAGPLSAWFDAWADLLINYKPFHFTAYGGVSVGVEFTLDLWICTIHISIEIGATLFLAGPPLHGTVHVDFWVHGFDIDFGDSAGGPEERLILDQFYELLLQADLSKADDDDDGCEHGSSATLEDPPSNLPPPHVYSCNEGLIPTGDSESTPNKADEPWRVRGAVFQFTVGCKFAIDSADVVTGQVDPNAPKIDPHHIPGNGQAIYARPMHLTDKLRSTLTVTITPEDPPARRLDELVDPPPLVPVWDNGVAVTKPVPKALWGMYSATDDPNSPFNPDPNHNPNLLQPSNTGNPSSPTDTLVPLTMGVTLSSPLPRISTDWIPSFNPKTFFVRNVDEPVKFPSPEPSNPAWYPRPLADGGDDEWEYVRAKWDATPGLGVGAAELAVKTWAGLSFAGWRVDEEMGDITGRKPGALLDKDSGEFERVYLEAMRVCAVA